MKQQAEQQVNRDARQAEQIAALAEQIEEHDARFGKLQ